MNNDEVSREISENITKIVEWNNLSEEEKEKRIRQKDTEIEEAKIILGKTYESIKQLLTRYIDLKDEYKTMIALWIIGTYFHDDFETYPYLFLNAMRGSGKTRTLKLINNLSWNGQLLASLTEAVLFRSKGTLAIDEFESVGSKEKQALRELLNAGYKKGIKIRRMKKVKRRQDDGSIGEGQESEEFDAYRPIIMANIWGMDEVLGDRCIHLALEKSSSIQHTKKIEDFTTNPEILAIKANLSKVSVVLCSVVTPKNIINDWNNYIDTKYITTPNYIIHLTAQNSTNYIKEEDMFKKIDLTELDGRHLELFFPFFIISNFLDYKIFDEILKISKEMVDDKRIDEIMESKDVMLFDFISRKYEPNTWVAINELTKDFRDFIGDNDEKAEMWLNSKWMGRALKRLCLIAQKRRLGHGVDVIINKQKADDKMKIFHH